MGGPNSLGRRARAFSGGPTRLEFAVPVSRTCRAPAHQIFTHEDAPGANPGLPTGLDPGNTPVVGGGS